MPKIDHTRLLRSKTVQGEVLARKTQGGIWRKPAPASATRIASTAASTQLNEGHSLTDAYTLNGILGRIYQAIFGVAPGAYTQAKRTWAGASGAFRWQNAPAGAQDTARYGMMNFDTLMLVERGLASDTGGKASVAAPWTDQNEFLIDLHYDIKFCNEAIANGRANPSEVILWGVWPGTDMISWQEIMVDEHRRHKLRVDYLTWKMRQMYPSLSAGWRVWLIPGYRLMQKLISEVGTTWPGPETTWSGFLNDTIHPSPKMEAGLAYFVATAIYKIDLRTLANPYVFPERMTPAEADWFMGAAWNTLSNFGPCGMGGTLDVAPEWTIENGGDFHPGITDPASLATYTGVGQKIDTVWNGSLGAVPSDAVAVLSAQGYTGPAFDVALPAPTGNYIAIPGAAVRTANAGSFATGVWQMALCQLVNDGGGSVDGYVGSVGRNDWPADPHAGRSAGIRYQNGVTSTICSMSEGLYGGGEFDLDPDARIDLTPHQMYLTQPRDTNGAIAFWMNTTERGIRKPDGTLVTRAATAYPAGLTLWRLGSRTAGMTLRIWAWIVMNRMPTVAEMNDMADWCQAKRVGR